VNKVFVFIQAMCLNFEFGYALWQSLIGFKIHSRTNSIPTFLWIIPKVIRFLVEAMVLTMI